MEVLDLADETDARVAAERLKSDIRSGALAPGYKLRIAELRTRYGIGASPLREALSMVASLGYVTSESHRGYRVAAVSRADLADITRTREVIETEMLRESMLAHDDEWAISVISATERLRRLTGKAETLRLGRFDPIESAHKQLHIALVAGCSSKRMGMMQELLFDQAGRYRDIMIGEVSSPQHFFEVHERLVQIILSGDIERACEALRAHLRITLHDVYPEVGVGVEVKERAHASAALAAPLAS